MGHARPDRRVGYFVDKSSIRDLIDRGRVGSRGFQNTTGGALAGTYIIVR